MNNIRYKGKVKYTYILILAAILVVVLGAVLLKGFFGGKEPIFLRAKSVQAYDIYVNDIKVGTVAEMDAVREWLTEARKELAAKSDELVFVEVKMNYKCVEAMSDELDSKETVMQQMLQVMEADVIQTMQRSYTVKVNEYMANLSSADEVKQLLEAAIGKYDAEDDFAVTLLQDTTREINVLQAQVVENEKAAEKEGAEIFPIAGVEEEMALLFKSCEPEKEKDFADYEIGIKDMSFPEEIEIVEAYLPKSQMKSLEVAVHELTEEQEQQIIYEVQSGDTLSEIAIAVNIPMDDIVAMNDSLEDVNSMLQIGQELIITVPEPELSVERHEVNYYEEIYDEEIIYIDVDDWYTYEKEVIQQPSAGFRKVVVEETYINDELESREILKEEVVMEAVAKIVKRGTIVPPSYIKPLSGGRKSSGFGPRTAPTKGASTYHKGQDWATPVGTPIYASSGGTVAKAGWGSGYGYVVYINHPDGRQTRYAHLSKILVKVGETVKQGEKIALSGNTGISSGPHLHFEMLIDGKQVNPLNYLD